MKLTNKELRKILDSHKKWLNGKRGERANLSCADLRCVDLKGADLRYADLYGADLEGADLEYTNLKDADLRGVNLKGANLEGADLDHTALEDADLKGTNLDYSCLQLWCGGLDIHIDERLFKQLLYHVLQNALYSKNVNDDIKEKIRNSGLIELANKSHIVTEHGRKVLK